MTPDPVSPCKVASFQIRRQGIRNPNLFDQHPVLAVEILDPRRPIFAGFPAAAPSSLCAWAARLAPAA
jgi:hypothetical protein